VRYRYAPLALLLCVASCSEKSSSFDDKEVAAMLIGQDRGLIAGVDIGDSWESIKGKSVPGVVAEEVDDPNLGKQYLLRPEKLLAFGTRAAVNLTVDEAGKVSGIWVHVSGSKDDKPRAAKVGLALIDHFDAKLGKSECAPKCAWKASSGGGQPLAIEMTQQEGSDSFSFDLNVNAGPAN